MNLLSTIVQCSLSVAYVSFFSFELIILYSVAGFPLILSAKSLTSLDLSLINECTHQIQFSVYI